MGRLIEVVSGQAFDAFLKARLFDPLGMASTGFMVKAEDVGRFTSNYAPFGGALIPFDPAASLKPPKVTRRSEEHTSELQSLMRISYAVFCLTKKKTTNVIILNTQQTIHYHTQQT